MPSGVRTLQTLAEPFVGARFEQNLGGLERSWENILRVGLPHLRKRIEDLYKEGEIVIPPSDLIKMAEGATDGNLHIRSPHGLRTLPIHGLFIFHDKGDAKDWAEGLLKSKITRERYISAEKLAKTIWGNYNNDDLIERHARFSMLHVADKSNEEYNDLKNTFKLQETERGNHTCECTAGCSDIKSENVACDTREDEKNERRWAALFLIRWLLKRMLCFIEATNIGSISRDGDRRTQSLFPTFEEDDIFLLLYPVPTNPIPLPWHIDDAKVRDNKKGAWHKWIKNKQRTSRNI